MIIPDTNLLLYATVDAFPVHDQVRTWWRSVLRTTEEVGIAPVCGMAFIRIATRRGVLAEPMTVSFAVAAVRSWLSLPQVRVLPADGTHFASAMALVEATGAAGNLTTDAQIAAHALALDATVATNDSDFARFPGVRTMNPVRG